MELKVGASRSRKPAPREVALDRRARDGQRARHDVGDLLRGITLRGQRTGAAAGGARLSGAPGATPAISAASTISAAPSRPVAWLMVLIGPPP